MTSRFGNFLAHFVSSQNQASRHQMTASINDIDDRYESFEAFTLGTSETSDLRRRDRKTILTTWASMQHDPTIAAALNLHVTAALGGHESRGDVVFMTPATKLRGSGKRAKELRRIVEQEARFLTPLFNDIAFSMCRYSLGYGDGYARMYGFKGHGLDHIMCNEYTEAPLIQAYEQGGRTVGFHVLEKDDTEYRRLTKLTTTQMSRMKMARYTPVPQFRIAQFLHQRLLSENDINKLPIIPAEVGGSILYDAEEPWANVQLLLQALNSQQIADSVQQAFLTIDVSGMPPAQRQKYQKGLINMLQKHKNNVKEALRGGDAIWSRAWHVLPVWGDKQVLNPVGDLSQRSAPLNTENLMINVRRMCGAMGMDMALLGWAEQLAGGLGDGAMFHTSAQVMQKSIHIRQAFTRTLNHMANIHFGHKYGYMFNAHELPWQFEFYSDMSAASTEALTNKQTRSNTLALFGQAIGALSELNLGKEANFLLLSKIGGCDDEEAELLSQALSKKADHEQDLNGQSDGMINGQNPDNQEDPDNLVNLEDEEAQ